MEKKGIKIDLSKLQDEEFNLYEFLKFIQSDAVEVVINSDLEAEVERLQKEVEELRERSTFLSCLEGAGVDNWEGYSDAWDMYNGEY